MALPSSSTITDSGNNGGLTDLPNATDWAGQDGTLKPEIWSELVRRDIKEKNVFKDFMGGEGSNQPVIQKRDLSAGGKTRVTFTSTTPIRGQGVLGEAVLKGNEDNLRFGTHSVEVDLIRHAVAYTQVLQLLRFTGKTLDQLSAELMSDWSARKQQDDMMLSFRNNALAQTANTATIGTWLSDSDNLSATGATLTTDAIEESKLRLIAAGAQPMATDSDYSGADVPQYLMFAPANIMNELRGDGAYAPALQYAAQRSTTDHPYFKGTLPAWENNVIYSHNIIFDTAEGRQGSPLLPIAFLGTAVIANATATQNVLDGGGQYANNKLDYFANFLGYDVQFTSYSRQFGTLNNPAAITNGAAKDTRNYFCTAYDTQTHEWNTYLYNAEDVGATDAGSIGKASSNVLTIAASGLKGAKDTTTKRRGLSQGSIIYQSDAIGKPIGFALHLAGNAMYYAEGSISSEPIYHYDDFATSGGRAHLTATGVQSIRGLAPFKDTLGRMPNFNVLQVEAKIVGVKR
jgi:N4-gp56 family major capsid protein